ncbi:MAG: hypothetical protein AUG51_17545 [Acidobacteria bacterium 13_1_20CM_3_53_8]|nr:MAG: hypothetical protein AUG51_17545 [Acidobacteria bacterium 13_1_20CM_3_53_8]
MKRFFIAIVFILLTSSFLLAQQRPNASTTPTPAPNRAQTARPQQAAFDLTQYGVRIQPEPRLVVMMAALDAAGFDPVPHGEEPSPFRAQVRRDQINLDPELRARMKKFFELNNRQLATATPAEQAARYVSLAYALGPVPNFEAPERSIELPGGLLEVLDFVPLLREFYQKSGIDARLPAYLRMYQAEGDLLRRPTIEMVKSVLSYLHTQPVTTYSERVVVNAPGSNNSRRSTGRQKTYTFREHERRFFIVPDLLAVPGAINFRIIADDYYAIVPQGTDPTSSELRRAYIQYAVDPVVLHFNREIAARRTQIKQLLDERTSHNQNISPDIFIAVARSLVAAAEARLDVSTEIAALTYQTRQRLAGTQDAAVRAQLAKQFEVRKQEIEDEGVAELADAYEQGAVLAFYFADQLRSSEESGFDIANFLGDAINTFDPARESRRLDENAQARARAVAARRARAAARANAAANETGGDAENVRRATLVRKLSEVEQLLRIKNYEEAENRLRQMLTEFPGEPRIFFALGQTASLSAQDAIDESVQAQRLERALSHFQMAVRAASTDTDQALLSRAHTAMGRILAFLERRQEAIREFDEAIKIGRVDGGAFNEATEAKQALVSQP